MRHHYTRSTASRLVATVIAAGLGPSVLPAQRPDAGVIVLRDATVIDPVTGGTRSGRTIVVRANRIASVGGPAAAVPPGAREVDARGAFAIPGLWDMHGHMIFWGVEDQMMALMVANGVTGYREMWSTPADARRVRDRIRSGALAGPRLIASGNITDGFPPMRAGEVVIRSPADAPGLIDSLAREGAGFVKVYSMLDSVGFDAVARRARRARLPIGGHVPYSISALHAARLGQRSIEHLTGVVEACSQREATVVAGRRAWMLARTTDSTRVPSFGAQIAADQAVVAGSFDEDRCRRVLRALRSHGAWQVPTLGVLRNISALADPAIVRAERAPYVPKILAGFWTMMATDTNYNRATATKRDYHAREREVVRLLGALGIPLLAGTDSPNPYIYPGFGLHDELELLVDAGLTPLQALQAATINPARYFQAEDSLGTIAPGKVADIVLLEANPLEDIRNTRAIRAVVADGRLFRRTELDSLLAGVARTVAATPAAPPPGSRQ